MGKRRVFAVKYAPTTGQLRVRVVDGSGQPVAGAHVGIYPGGASTETDSDGIALFKELHTGHYDIAASKAGHGATPYGPERRTNAGISLAAGTSAQHTLTLHRLPRVLTENIVLVGSERLYNSFKLKMMFVGPAVTAVNRSLDLRSADRTTVLFVDDGYTRFERLAMEQLTALQGVKVVPVTTVANIVDHFNARPSGDLEGVPTKTLLQDVVIFSHGSPGKLTLNYSILPGGAIDFTDHELGAINADIFVPEGRIVSYACRTGTSVDAESLPNDAAAKPEFSLAQKMADHFGIEVYAYLSRTFYGNCLVAESDYDALASALNSARGSAAGGVVDLPPDHEALPHSGIGGLRAMWAGTDDYALWRKKGALAMPVGHDTPTGLSQTIRRFRPYE
jgi:hypothetical protein